MKSRYILLVIVIAAIMAIAAFITISLWLRSPETPAVEQPLPTPLPGGEGGVPAGLPRQIDGVVVYLNVDPANAVRLQDSTTPREPVATIPPLQPTATSPAQVQPLPTAPPPVSTSPPPAASAVGPVAGVEPIIFIQYPVQAEDTLYRITEKQRTSIELMATRGIDANDLVVGNVLNLPVANPNYCAASTPYVIQPGDTVFSIATRFNTTTDRLAAINNLGASFRIDIADILCIP